MRRPDGLMGSGRCRRADRTTAMPANTSAEATSVRLENGSDSKSVPRTTAMIGLTYEYSETVDTGRCFSAYT